MQLAKKHSNIVLTLASQQQNREGLHRCPIADGAAGTFR
jgi:hypothetical protein